MVDKNNGEPVTPVDVYQATREMLVRARAARDEAHATTLKEETHVAALKDAGLKVVKYNDGEVMIDQYGYDQIYIPKQSELKALIAELQKHVDPDPEDYRMISVAAIEKLLATHQTVQKPNILEKHECLVIRHGTGEPQAYSITPTDENGSLIWKHTQDKCMPPGNAKDFILPSRADTTYKCQQCGTEWATAYGYGPGDTSGWVRITEDKPADSTTYEEARTGKTVVDTSTHHRRGFFPWGRGRKA